MSSRWDESFIGWISYDGTNLVLSTMKVCSQDDIYWDGADNSQGSDQPGWGQSTTWPPQLQRHIHADVEEQAHPEALSAVFRSQEPYITLVDMGVIWRMATPSAEDRQRQDGIQYKLSDYVHKLPAMLMLTVLSVWTTQHTRLKARSRPAGRW